MFIGRSRELNKLNALYNSNQFEFAVFYGRRRVGKTMLINEFIERKKAVYYMAVEGTKKENLTGLSKLFFKILWRLYLNLVITRIYWLISWMAVSFNRRTLYHWLLRIPLSGGFLSCNFFFTSKTH